MKWQSYHPTSHKIADKVWEISGHLRTQRVGLLDFHDTISDDQLFSLLMEENVLPSNCAPNQVNFDGDENEIIISVKPTMLPIIVLKHIQYANNIVPFNRKNEISKKTS